MSGGFDLRLRRKHFVVLCEQRTTDAAVSARLDICRRSSRIYFSLFATRTVDNTVDLYAGKPDIRPESLFLPTVPAFDSPIRAVHVGLSPSRLAFKNYNGLATR